MTCPASPRRLPYLADLGVDAVWLSPFYPSELADGGYDVADYRDVDPRLGTLDDFDAMVAEAHRLGPQGDGRHRPQPHLRPARLVPGGAARRAPAPPARERYVFREGKGEHGELPPTDWRPCFGGPAWTRLPDG